ncbi:hypothetical protein AD942_00315 [Gluconobacter japonicus]|uniref:hypothetical protein n=1 Tax=Gluconobacter japonicus TaxID=376620 RepID=UPI000781CA03|nr:hypothetical protein [Gluconobacter japonicus]KXV35667.1 hypothetical protein AD936_15115 [Gluconobacter japonicus]KXV42205.1 hypothetical protein AD942_00315 [Gluconobacter japonicus]
MSTNVEIFFVGDHILEALFYPALSLPGAAWTNPNLLFFDRIGVIAPIGPARELFDGPTRLLIEHNLVRPIEPFQYAIDYDDDDNVLSYLLGMAQNQKRCEVARIHLGKLNYSPILLELVKHKLLWKIYHEEWLEGPTWVIEYIMSVLALRIVANRNLNLSLLTNLPSAGRLVAGIPPRNQTLNSRRLRAVAQLLPVGPDAEIKQILKFREQHQPELRAFRGFLETLLRRSPTGHDGEADFEARLREAERVRNHLVGELDSIRKEAPALPIALSIAAIAAAAVEISPYSTGVGVAGLGYLLHARGVAARREGKARHDKLVFSALTAKTFAARRSDTVLG